MLRNTTAMTTASAQPRVAMVCDQAEAQVKFKPYAYGMNKDRGVMCAQFNICPNLDTTTPPPMGMHFL